MRKNSIKLLAIGNSFSVDALQYFYQIASSLGIKNITIVNLYIGSCSLETHLNNLLNKLPKYIYYTNNNGEWIEQQEHTVNDAILEHKWDYISFQQVSSLSGVESSYNETLLQLVDEVKNLFLSKDNPNRNENVKFIWHMTWAYQQNTTHPGFINYNNDQLTMYNNIVSCVQNKILTNKDFSIIIPNATSIQNARTSILGDTLTRDGFHMSYDLGRYITGLMFFKQLTNISIDNISYSPNGVTEEQKEIAIKSVNCAYKNPYQITQIN